jgi:hypothetical protein
MKVYILGAGASVHAGYPFATGLGTGLASWIENRLPLEHRYRLRLDQVTRAYGTLANFEGVLADLMMCLPGSPAAGLPSGVRPYLLSDLQEAMREYFDTIRTAPAPLYEQLAQGLRKGDLVVTFNYDLGIERELRTVGLWDIRSGYGFPINGAEETSPVEVLKLHGSTNWRALLFGGATGFGFASNSLGDRPVLFFRPDLDYLGYQNFSDPRCAHVDTAATVPAMIMPALPKQFYFATTFGREWEGFWNHLWQRAEQSLQEAEELVIIGYSMPAADERACALLLGTSKVIRLTICCANATKGLEQKFRDHGFNNIQHLTDPTFAGWLTHQA